MRDARILSLLPSITEVVVALGFGDHLVGRSHECDFPPFVSNLPVCTATKVAKGLPSLEIEERVQGILQQGLSVYSVDTARLHQLKPDVILTQSHCAICAVTPRDLEEALASWVGPAPRLLSISPETLDELWEAFRLVARTLNVEKRGERVVAEYQGRLNQLAERSRGLTRPRVASIEWIEPLMAAGNWVPELVEAAGGESLFAATGQHSPWIDWEELADADPEVIVFMPCGFSIKRSLQELPLLTRDSRWAALTAVKNNRVHLADGHHFFNRPGPRLIESAEILAEILHPVEFDFGHKGRSWITVQS